MRLTRFFPLAALAASLLCTTAVRADVKLPALFSDGMVLQRGVDCAVWGQADPGQFVEVSFTDGLFGTKIRVVAREDGSFRVSLPFARGIGPNKGGDGEEFNRKLQQGGGPFTLSVKCKNTVEIKNVLIGEVWIASGQSNMEMSVNSSAGAAEAKAAAANPNLRLFTVKKTASDTPQTDVPRDGTNGKWLTAGPDTIGGFSAVAYYLRRDIQKARNVPVGIIHTSWGGTAAEEWTRLDILKDNPKHLGKHPRQAKLYNGMIAPLIPYAIKGAIWYQGE